MICPVCGGGVFSSHGGRCSRCATLGETIWECLEDPEGVFVGRTVKGFWRTLSDGNWPAGSLWRRRSGGRAYRVVECGNQQRVEAE